jgi:uncharacterized membrane-anchored protein
LGETGGDLLAQTLNVGCATSTIIFFSFFLIAVTAQLLSRHYIPPIYWAVIVATSTAGTTMSDYMDRTLNLGYALGSLILISILVVVLMIWRMAEKTFRYKYSFKKRRGILLDSYFILKYIRHALGDFLADDSGLGFGGSTLLISGVLLLIILAYYFTRISRVILFWIAFVLTRPFSATFGDLLTKSHEKSGLGYGTVGASLILFAMLIGFVTYEILRLKKQMHVIHRPKFAN